ncbi:MAG TPA: hypothetical protein ENK18_00895 [Deltaproteobacteria bacterium]|nr:hypothetical protein [Deltaproteobacteria bacterium]
MISSRVGWIGLVVACGGGSTPLPSSSTDPVEVLLEGCVTQCDSAAEGEGCDTEAIRAECPGVCAFLTELLSTDCLNEYEGVIACEASQDFVCNGSLEVEGVDWPVLEDGTACEDADDLYQACFDTLY